MKRTVFITVSNGSMVTSCGTRPISARAARKSATTSWPATVIRPSASAVMPQIIEISVVLPAPFGPSRARISPSSMARSTPFSASNPVA